MARRYYPVRFQCAAKGCPERANYEAETRADEKRLYETQQRTPWTCTRHTRPDEVVTADARDKTITLTSLPSEDYPNSKNRYWTGEDGRRQSGFVYGPGFKAYASDFPEGARLTITATLELPPPDGCECKPGPDDACICAPGEGPVSSG